MSKYDPGDVAYIVESGHIIREVKVIRVSGGMYTLRFADTGGGVKLREGRVFPTKEDAENSIKPFKSKTKGYTKTGTP